MMKNYCIVIALSMVCLLASPSLAGSISLQQARAEFDKAKYKEREAELYFAEAKNRLSAYRAEVKHQRMLEKGDVNRSKALFDQLIKMPRASKKWEGLNREYVDVNNKLTSAYNARVEKGIPLNVQMAHRGVKVRQAEESLIKAYQVLVKAMKDSTPPILQSVQVKPESENIVYDVVWQDMHNKGLNKSAAEDKRRELRISLANLELARDKLKKDLDQFRYDRARYVSDEVIAGMKYSSEVSEYVIYSQIAVIAPALTEALGVIIELYASGGVSGLDAAISIISKAAVAAEGEIGNKHIGTFVSNLSKRLKRELKPVKKYEVAKNSLISDSMEEVTGKVLENGIKGAKWLAKKYPDLGKIILQTEKISIKSLHRFVKWPEIGSSTALAAVNVALKAAVAQYFQNIVNKVELNAFKAYFDHEFAQTIINKSIQKERPTRDKYKLSLAAIADAKRALNEASPIWQRSENENIPLRDFQLDKPVRISLMFSQPLMAAPIVSLGSQRLSFKASGGLPTSSFTVDAKINHPSGDGKYDLPLRVSLASSEKAYQKLDADPTTTPVLNGKTGLWSFVEGGQDASHTIQIFSLKALIKEMGENSKEIRKYIIAMDKKLDFAHSKETVKKALAAAGVGFSQMYSGHWGQDILSWNWYINSGSPQKYFIKHAVAMADSVDYLRRTESISNDEIRQLREGMDSLRQFMPDVKRAYMVCWFKQKIQQGLAWDSADKLLSQTYDIRPYEDGDPLREQAAILHKQGEKSGEYAEACFAAVAGILKYPMFVSLKTYHEMNKK